jgi:hypothetical protein
MCYETQSCHLPTKRDPIISTLGRDFCYYSTFCASTVLYYYMEKIYMIYCAKVVMERNKMGEKILENG